jgi:hypothetical protein
VSILLYNHFFLGLIIINHLPPSSLGRFSGIPNSSTLCANLSITISPLSGLAFEEFRIHIESLFTEEMNWSNYATYWQLDHKIPISWANSEDDVYRLNHYTNFKPMYWRDNIIKGNRSSD